MAAARPSTWLITGASSGFGKSLALEALKAGNKVVGTSRDVSKAELSVPVFSAKGGIWIELGPAQKNASEQFSKCAEEHDIDVLVNNAGYAFIGAVEDTSEDEFRDQMEVNFYGPLRTVRACIPTMRAKGFGNIVLISSGSGFFALPGRASYCASKFAIEAVHEALSNEVKGFGIKVLIVEPGAFRTPFGTRIRTPAQCYNGFSEPYRGTMVEKMVTGSRGLVDIPGFVKGDPDKAAQKIVKAVIGGHDYLRMPFGDDCVDALENKIEELQRDLDATRSIATNVNVD